MRRDMRSLHRPTARSNASLTQGKRYGAPRASSRLGPGKFAWSAWRRLG